MTFAPADPPPDPPAPSQRVPNAPPADPLLDPLAPSEVLPTTSPPSYEGDFEEDNELYKKASGYDLDSANKVVWDWQN